MNAYHHNLNACLYNSTTNTHKNIREKIANITATTTKITEVSSIDGFVRFLEWTDQCGRETVRLLTHFLVAVCRSLVHDCTMLIFSFRLWLFNLLSYDELYPVSRPLHFQSASFLFQTHLFTLAFDYIGSHLVFSQYKYTHASSKLYKPFNITSKGILVSHSFISSSRHPDMLYTHAH